jgi:ABC-type phosphate/phosphonate transport system substrate-binding protein
MSRTTHRALTVLALSAALAIGTTAVAVAAEDLNEQRKALYQSELDHNLKAAAPVEDQNDRLLRGIETAAAARTQAAIEQARAGERQFAATAAQSAVEQVRAGERNLGPAAPVVTVAPQPVPAATGRGLDPLAVLLLGLVGGLVVGAAATAGWTAHRRHAHRVVAA